jgi:hypothetical protein
MAKRTYFIISTVFLSILFFLLNLVGYQWKVSGIFGFSFGIGLFYLVLFYGIAKKRLNLFFSSIFPVLFTLGIGLFRFYFAISWIWQVVLMILFILAIYTILLVENVFLVSAESKVVPLYRAASTVGFLLSLVTAFFLFEVIFSFRLSAFENFILIFAVCFPLLIHFFWFSNLSTSLTGENLKLALMFSVILGEIALIISFWPLGATKSSLYLVSLFYVFGGLAQQFCQEKLFKNTIREFVWVGLGTFLALIMVTSWRGIL